MQRTCLGCQQTDDHPKDQVVLADGNSVFWHMDCHAIATGCKSCAAYKDGASHLVGDEFRAHIKGLSPEFHQQLMERVNGA